MEFNKKPFTPKIVSKIALRNNPYASGGKQYMKKFEKHSARSLNYDITPPRKSFAHPNKNSENIDQLKKFRINGQSNISRSANILKYSQEKNNSDKNSTTGEKWLSKENNAPKKYPRNTLRKFLTSNYTKNDDPHNIFSDSDENGDVSLSGRYKPNDFDKENNISKCNNSQNENIRKPLNAIKSRILHDISPKKFSTAYKSSNIGRKDNCTFTFKSFANKENDLSQKIDDNTLQFPHMIGFPNFGNTCYLNAVLQTLVSLKPFVADLNFAISKICMQTSSLSHSLWSVIAARQKKDPIDVKKSLRNFKENIEKIDGTFSGFKMQDANEFLTKVLDTVKDEMDKYLVTPDNEKNENVPSLIPNKNVMFANGHSSLFDTPSPESPVSLELKTSVDASDDDDCNDIFLLKRKNKPSSVSLTPDNSVKSKNSIISNDIVTPSKSLEDIQKVPCNPVKKNFEFELLESYSCLGCNEVEGRKQKHFALYVNLPSKGKESIQEAVQAYMTEDQRELTCEKCGHKRASVLTRFEKFPRVLIVQLKRYEYKPEQVECIKVSSKVEVNLWLHLDDFSIQNGKCPPSWTPKPFRIETPRKAVNNSKQSVRNLSSALNGCDVNKNSLNTQEESMAVPDSTSETNGNLEQEKGQEDKELQEVMIRSMEEVGGPSENSREREEEEFQKAIKLSLQDMGMSHIYQPTDEEMAISNEDSGLFCDEVEKNSINQEGVHSYRLLSVISHFGLTTCTGHYVSDIYNCEDDKWLHYDDESVSNLNDNVVFAEGRQKNGYIFFYIHRDVYSDLKNLKTH